MEKWRGRVKKIAVLLILIVAVFLFIENREVVEAGGELAMAVVAAAALLTIVFSMVIIQFIFDLFREKKR